uniref:Uncharacterized protein n=1 Tax=Chromera velia CCMP2878 TaxID=1169474 RepID=A0A0G4GFY3_9ALVE|eukprot:Cvel_4656.t1-p1 / transcript=Cvel_4656.t1 / gene=Cvel_4656 / organism=Chromera_velia_CCMP2878 / gene_product=hypothetical protein / transcript_product=hypothetical protein / location=Cvel_scaffold205:85827-91066(+) / protein_length=193 / sequence_SO=supercontig / SO=protein_coding / is_pseudo=false
MEVKVMQAGKQGQEQQFRQSPPRAVCQEGTGAHRTGPHGSGRGRQSPPRAVFQEGTGAHRTGPHGSGRGRQSPPRAVCQEGTGAHRTGPYGSGRGRTSGEGRGIVGAHGGNEGDEDEEEEDEEENEEEDDEEEGEGAFLLQPLILLPWSRIGWTPGRRDRTGAAPDRGGSNEVGLHRQKEGSEHAGRLYGEGA